MHGQALIERSVALQATAARLKLEARQLRQDASARRARWPDLRRLCLARGGSEPRQSAPLILVVEDFADVREMFSMYFAANGFRVLEAGDGQSAMHLALEHVPAVILMDLGLPSIDGWEITRRLKGSPQTQHVRILALSGYGMPEDMRRAREAGADAFLTKPIAPSRVLERVRSLIGQPALRPR